MASLKVVAGVVAGVALGATLGILFAPNKGSATRRKIMGRGQAYADELGGKAHEMLDAISRRIEEISEDTIRMVENGKAHGEKKAVADKSAAG